MDVEGLLRLTCLFQVVKIHKLDLFGVVDKVQLENTSLLGYHLLLCVCVCVCVCGGGGGGGEQRVNRKNLRGLKNLLCCHRVAVGL